MQSNRPSSIRQRSTSERTSRSISRRQRKRSLVVAELIGELYKADPNNAKLAKLLPRQLELSERDMHRLGYR